MAARIQVESTVGEGTTFTVTLPMVPSTTVYSEVESEELDTRTRPGLRSLGANLRRKP